MFLQLRGVWSVFLPTTLQLLHLVFVFLLVIFFVVSSS